MSGSIKYNKNDRHVKDEYGLTPKQRVFADKYIELGNATKAALEAGYSQRSAHIIGQENLGKPLIRDYIDKFMQKQDKERIASAQEVLETYTKILRGELTGKTLIGRGMGEQEIVDIEPTLQEKLKAAEALAKRYAIFTERHQVDVTSAVQIIDDVDDK